MPKFEDLAVRYIVELRNDFDLEDFQAAGVVGNGGTESTGFTDIQENNPTAGRGGLGHFQWTGPRRVEFEAWIARNAYRNFTPELFEANYSMLFRELKGPEAGTIPALRRATTLEESTEVFMDKFERPGVPHLDNRISWARKALAAYKAAGSPTKAHAPGTTEVLPPLKLPPAADLAPLLNILAPVLLQFLQSRLQPVPASPGDTQAAQPDLAAILAQLLGGAAPKPAEPVAPPPAVVVTPAPAEPKTSVGLGLLGLFGSAIGMATGQIGTPFGMGAEPTTAGTLAVLIPTAISAIGATGILGPWGAVAGRIVGAMAGAIAQAPKK
jgi:hypothetical protein